MAAGREQCRDARCKLPRRIDMLHDFEAHYQRKRAERAREVVVGRALPKVQRRKRPAGRRDARFRWIDAMYPQSRVRRTNGRRRRFHTQIEDPLRPNLDAVELGSDRRQQIAMFSAAAGIAAGVSWVVVRGRRK